MRAAIQTRAERVVAETTVVVTRDRAVSSIHTLVMSVLNQVSIRMFASPVRLFSEFESTNTENKTFGALPRAAIYTR
ncbi:hypothetical protein HUU61_07100 [Rhodopseudomonas palustris]|nr:hypothetical protein [Rhodopseudomonas palustris]